MNDDTLHQLLHQADAAFQRAQPQPAVGRATLGETVRRLRARRTRRRSTLGALAVLLVAAGVFARPLRFADRMNHGDQVSDAASVNAKTGAPNKSSIAIATAPSKGPRLGREQIAQLNAEIAALESEANRACRFVELYRSAEARRERMAAAQAAVAEPFLPPDVVAQLEIDRAAAITIVSADAAINEFNRPVDAAESYRSVLKHFPLSRWASVARERLVQFGQMN